MSFEKARALAEYARTAHFREPRRVCLFGGTFDPIHKAHITIALEAKHRFKLTRTLLIPAANPPHKTDSQLTPYKDRFAMVALACRNQSGLEPSRLEEGAGRNFSIDTVERILPTLDPSDKLYFLLGSDAFEEIETWHRWQDLVRLLDFIVVTRAGYQDHAPQGARIHRIDGLDLPVSSSGIRARLAAGEPTPELPSAVRQYIDTHHLYGAIPAPTHKRAKR
jgi:nicotinate-nucleotide adenylyltransferase